MILSTEIKFLNGSFLLLVYRCSPFFYVTYTTIRILWFNEWVDWRQRQHMLKVILIHVVGNGHGHTSFYTQSLNSISFGLFFVYRLSDVNGFIVKSLAEAFKFLFETEMHEMYKQSWPYAFNL